MAQNSQRLSWTPEEVDAKLKGIMSECYNVSNFCCLFSINRGLIEDYICRSAWMQEANTLVKTSQAEMSSLACFLVPMLLGSSKLQMR